MAKNQKSTCFVKVGLSSKKKIMLVLLRKNLMLLKVIKYNGQTYCV